VITGPRGRWATIAVWLLLGAAGLLADAHIDDVTAAGQSSFLPADAESTRAVKALQGVSGGGEEVPVVVVFERPGGLTKRDLRAIGQLGDGLDRLALTGATPVLDPFSGASRYRRDLAAVAGVANGVGPISRDGEAALLFLAIDAQNRGAVVSGVDRIRAYLHVHGQPGLRAFVTGPGGIAADLALLAILGDRAFWPAIPAHAPGQGGPRRSLPKFTTEGTSLTHPAAPGSGWRGWCGGARGRSWSPCWRCLRSSAWGT
jgi:putative drug exporter of the RND superfamily